MVRLNIISMDEKPIIKRKEFLHFHRPSFGVEEKEELLATLDSGWITTGPRTKEFEKRFAEYREVKHAIGVNSCTAGLHLALLANMWVEYTLKAKAGHIT